MNSSRFGRTMNGLRGFFFSFQTMTGLYVALIIVLMVMGFRSSLFITTLVPVWVYNIGGTNVSALGLLIAVSFVMFVASGSFYAGRLDKGTREWKQANAVRMLAVIGDGLFNLVETVYAVVAEDRTAGVFEVFNPAVAKDAVSFYMYWIVRVVVILGIVGIGIVPTLLAFMSSELLGSLQREVQGPANVVYLSDTDWDAMRKVYDLVKDKWFTVGAISKAIGVDKDGFAITVARSEKAGILISNTRGRYRFSDVNRLAS